MGQCRFRKGKLFQCLAALFLTGNGGPDDNQVLRGIGLVYGGGSVGLMGMVSRVVNDGGRDVLGYCTISLTLPVSLWKPCV